MSLINNIHLDTLNVHQIHFAGDSIHTVAVIYSQDYDKSSKMYWGFFFICQNSGKIQTTETGQDFEKTN